MRIRNIEISKGFEYRHFSNLELEKRAGPLILTVRGFHVDQRPALHICVARLGVNFLVSQ